MKRPEQNIQRAVFEHLAARPSKGVFAFHCPNGGWRSPVEAAIFKGLGVVPGIPDIIACPRYALELKTLTGKLTSDQTATMAALEASGTIVGVAYGLDDALTTLETWGLLRGKAK